MFSKALFKQSCKANGTMWAIITFAVCFMLACVMLISGNGNIGEIKNGIQDTIIEQEITSQVEDRAIGYYTNADDGLAKFDELFAKDASDTLSLLVWFGNMPNSSTITDPTQYAQALAAWQSAKPQASTEAGVAYDNAITNWQNAMPDRANFSNDEQYAQAVASWKEQSPASQEQAIAMAYASACEQLQVYIEQKAENIGYEKTSQEAQEMLGSVMYVLNPNGMFNEFYTENGESVPDDYDVISIVQNIVAGKADEYVSSSDRADYRSERAMSGSKVFIAGNMIKTENVDAITDALSGYGVTADKLVDYGYSYVSIKKTAGTAIATYKGRIAYELEEIEQKYADGEYATEEEYVAAVENKKQELKASITTSFLSTLPDMVSEALEEIGKLDLYTLVVGSIFYKLAGLLLPIIYMIMASNNLIAGQVDSGSMAYVLSTSTKRITVAFTQAVYLVGSLFAMFSLTTITGCICLATISESVALTYGNLVLLNLGAFLVLFALSGLNFFTSCYFDRSKRSMAIGGGLSIFALVAAMLGLFGSPAIPTVVRLKSLNYFNYVTLISLFDVLSIMEGTTTFIWKLVILLVVGIVGYVAGAFKFTKKDLPL